MINFVVVHSNFESENDIKIRLNDYIDVVKKNEVIKECNFISEKPNKSTVAKYFEKPLLILVATGGTEQIVSDLIEDMTLPVLLIAPNQKNAVAASLEIYSVFKQKYNILLKYVNSATHFSNVLTDFIDVASAIYNINIAKVGLVGAPSDWLLTSKNLEYFGDFNTELIYIPTETIIEDINNIDDNDNNVKNFVTRLNSYPRKKIITDNDLLNSGKVYSALKNLSDSYKLQAITVRCFDFLPFGYTACMGLSLINEEGVLAGCEGDLHAVFSMMIARFITGKPAWMANPSSINFDDNFITVAHCSAPLDMLKPDSIELNTHMESGLSVAVSGELDQSDVTIFRTGDNFNKMLAISGKIVTSKMGDDNLCRTQAIIKLDDDVSDWLNNSLGNHQVIVYGNIIEKLKVFCKLTNIEFIQ